MNTQPFDQSFKLLKNSYKFGVAALLSLAFFIASTMPVLASPQVTFTGTNLGAIPDSTSAQPNCQTPGPPRDVTFNVTGLTGNVQTVTISLTIEHPWVGDVLAILIAPGGTRQLDLFGYTGATVGPGSNASAGDSSPIEGQYTFSDAATASWWAAAAAASSTTLIPGGTYRTSQRGGPGSTGANTSLNATFGGLTAAQANGTWTLRVTDGCASDTGTVSAATLDITTVTTNPPVAAKPFFDYFGSGKSSFAVYNGTGTNVIWRVLNNGGAGQETIFWGLTAADALTPGYFDADNRADIGVWRPSSTAGESRFYIRHTNPVALNAFPFGATSDFAGYDADYDGDGRDDPTTIRRVNGQWLWSYRASTTNTLRSVAFGSATGTSTEDVPMAGGDFTGDGRADLVVIRQNANGPDSYIWGDSVTGQQISSFTWGDFSTDYYVLGDFLGDTRIDFAVWRNGGDGYWYIRENGGTGFVARFLGNPGGTATTRDIAVAGDFGGDSKYDIAIYRQTNNTFYWLDSPNFLTFRSQQFGLAGDRPVGELRTY
jgi:subtilisin-like proprotein convertase family protein